MSQAAVWGIVIIIEGVVLLLDAIGMFAYAFAGGDHTSWQASLVTLISAVCDVVSFGVAFKNPRISFSIICSSVILSMVLAGFAYIRSSVRPDLFEVGLLVVGFWGPKLLLGVYFLQKSRLPSQRLAFGRS